MAVHMKKHESASAGARRLAEKALDQSLEMIGEAGDDPAKTVHEVRKELKKFRAILRLLRDETGEEIYRRDNFAARDLGRKLSPVRDAAVRVSALDGLKKKFESDFPTTGIAPVRGRLVSRHRAALSKIRKGSVLPAIAESLGELRRRVRTWPLGKAGFSGIEPGLRRVYRQGRDAEAEAYRSQTDETFHEWRKRAKDLRYQVDLLEPMWPEVMRDVQKALHELTDDLGDDHDLGDLRRVLRDSRERAGGAKAVDRVLELIERRRSDLRKAAQPIGAKIYGEKPKDFARRMGGYWDVWRA